MEAHPDTVVRINHLYRNQTIWISLYGDGCREESFCGKLLSVNPQHIEIEASDGRIILIMINAIASIVRHDN